MNNFYFKKEKVDEIFAGIKKGLLADKKILNKAFELDIREWEYEVSFDLLIEIIESFKEKEYLPVFSKDKIVDGFGRICLLCNQNPYLVFNFILSCIYTNNKVEVALEDKLLASNKALIESIKKSLKKLNVQADTVTYIELANTDDIISYQNNYDLIYYFGNKSTYINFIKRIHIDTKFEEFGEINLYFDGKEYKNEIIEIEKWAYLTQMSVNIYNSDLDEAITEINSLNNISKMSVIFSNNMESISRFIKEIKSSKVYVNINPIRYYKAEIDLNNLVYSKIVKW